MRRTKNEGQQICANLLSDGTILEIITSFRRLLETSYGPNGRLKFLQTCAGGHVTITSSSSQLVNHLIGMSHPVLRIIMMAIKGHLDMFRDGGLTMGILITRLVESSVKLELPRVVIVEVISDAQDILTSYLTSDACQWRMKVDVGDMKTMLCLVRGVLETKPVCRLSEREQDFLSTALLKAFLQSLPSPNSSSRKQSLNPIQFLTCEGCPVTDTKIINGVLVEAPELPTYNLNTAVRNLKVALYNVSMAGDTDEWIEGVTPVAMGDLERDDLNKGVLEMLKGVAFMLAKESVGLVACQKVIHPALKAVLKEKGIYVIDRLSVLHIGSVQRLTGATILSTFTTDIPSEWFGHVGSIEHTVINNKSYLLLLPAKEFSSSQPPISESSARLSPSSKLPATTPSSQSYNSTIPSSLSQSVEMLSKPSLAPQLSPISSSFASSSSSSSRDLLPSISRQSLRAPPPPTLFPQSSLRQQSPPAQNHHQHTANQSPPSCPVTTMILCAPDETSVNELKIVCQSVISLLHGVVTSPYVVPGGGCLDTHLAWYVRSTARSCDDSRLEKLGCTRAQYITVMDNVASCLEAVARCLDHDGGDHVADSTNHHHWILGPGEVPSNSDIPSCTCGLVSRDDCENWCILGNDYCYHVAGDSVVNGGEMRFQDNILDLHLAKVTLLQAAFETASVILRVKHFVSD